MRFYLWILSILLFSQLVTADIQSLSSGSSESVLIPTNDLEGFFFQDDTDASDTSGGGGSPFSVIPLLGDLTISKAIIYPSILLVVALAIILFINKRRVLLIWLKKREEKDNRKI